MSRSIRKTPIGSYNCGDSEKNDKQIYNRKFRRKTRESLLREDYDNLLFNIRQVSNVWRMSKDGKRYYGSYLHADTAETELERLVDRLFYNKLMRK